MEEIFKDLEIDGLERYQISNKGRVVSNRTTNPKFLKPQTDSLGYQHVRLYPEDHRFGVYPDGRGKIPKLEKVHRLVATHFLEVPTDENEIWTVNHKDGVKSNNHVDNLEWITHGENIQHSWDLGLRTNGSKQAAKKKWKPVKVIYKDGREEYYLSQMHAATVLNTTPGTVWNKVENVYKDSYGKLGWTAVRIDESDLPPGETWKTIADIELKMAKLRERFWHKDKMKQYQRAKRNASKKKS